MEVRDEEGDVVSLKESKLQSDSIHKIYLYWFPSQNKECFRSLCQESRKLVDQNMFYFVCLFDFDADAHTVDAGLDEDTLILISCHRQGIEKDLRGGLSFDFWHIVPLRGLGCEVG